MGRSDVFMNTSKLEFWVESSDGFTSRSLEGFVEERRSF